MNDVLETYHKFDHPCPSETTYRADTQLEMETYGNQPSFSDYFSSTAQKDKKETERERILRKVISILEITCDNPFLLGPLLKSLEMKKDKQRVKRATTHKR